jgi:hypothetical protein
MEPAPIKAEGAGLPKAARLEAGVAAVLADAPVLEPAPPPAPAWLDPHPRGLVDEVARDCVA